MKLRNKKTGEIVENAYIRESYDSYNKRTIIAVFARDGSRPPERVSTGYETLAELNNEWKDAPEEPKVGHIIDPMAEDCVTAEDSGYEEPDVKRAKELGIWFETEEEAEKAVEKFKARKRLKDKGFEFRWIDMQTGQIKYAFFLKKGQKVTRGDEDDLLLLFGGEE